MRDAEWFDAVSAYSETIHMHPRAASAYIARGAANLYQGKHQDAIRDYNSAIEIAPDKPDYWLRRAYAASTADPPDAQAAIADATQAINLDPTQHLGYNHRAIAYTIPPNPDWSAALADIDQSISINPQHDTEAHILRAWIKQNLEPADK